MATVMSTRESQATSVFWAGRLRDDASSRVSSRWDAAHAAEDEALRANADLASLSSSIAGTLHGGC